MWSERWVMNILMERTSRRWRLRISAAGGESRLGEKRASEHLTRLLKGSCGETRGRRVIWSNYRLHPGGRQRYSYSTTDEFCQEQSAARQEPHQPHVNPTSTVNLVNRNSVLDSWYASSLITNGWQNSCLRATSRVQRELTRHVTHSTLPFTDDNCRYTGSHVP